MRQKLFMKNRKITDERFIFDVKSDNAGTSNSNQMTIPTDIGTYLYDAETSDGQLITGNTGNLTISFPTAGTYTIFISGTLQLLLQTPFLLKNLIRLIMTTL